jgi:hypothetical protein
MRIRRFLIALFALGTVAGYGSAIAGAACHAHARRAAYERHLAHLCADAAKNPDAAARDEPAPPW